MKTQTPEQYIVGPQAQWTQPWSRVQSQVDVIHLVHSTAKVAEQVWQTWQVLDQSLTLTHNLNFDNNLLVARIIC